MGPLGTGTVCLSLFALRESRTKPQLEPFPPLGPWSRTQFRLHSHMQRVELLAVCHKNLRGKSADYLLRKRTTFDMPRINIIGIAFIIDCHALLYYCRAPRPPLVDEHGRR